MKKVSLIFIAILFLISSMPSVFAEDIIRSPLVLHKVETIYPEEAKKQGIEGIAVLKVFISEKVQNIKIVHSSGNGSLDQAAIESVKQWMFVPATNSKGEKCATNAELAMVFKLM